MKPIPFDKWRQQVGVHLSKKEAYKEYCEALEWWSNMPNRIKERRV